VPDRGSPNISGPSVRRRRLAAELRRLRERAGFIGEDVAVRLGWSASKLSRIETSKIGVKLEDLQLLLDLYRVSEGHRSEVLALARESTRSSVPKSVRATLPGDYADFLQAEAEAESVWNWEPQNVPGLLQTEDYSRAIMLMWVSMFTLPPGEIDRRVETRRLRQQVLSREPPLRLSFVVDESVLYRKIGDASVMRRQLEYLIDVSRLPHVDLRILPLNGEHPIASGAFNYMVFPQFRDVLVHDMVTFEHLVGTHRAEAEEDTHKYYVAFEALRHSALAPGATRKKIAAVARERWA
jgi:transcriptional regulator with XRE-family HTH domain